MAQSSIVPLQQQCDGGGLWDDYLIVNCMVFGGDYTIHYQGSNVGCVQLVRGNVCSVTSNVISYVWCIATFIIAGRLIACYADHLIPYRACKHHTLVVLNRTSFSYVLCILLTINNYY